jgi:hypothetical protein
VVCQATFVVLMRRFSLGLLVLRFVPVDVSADEACLGGVVGVVGAGEREVPQCSELRLDAVQPGGVVRGVGQLDVARGGPVAHLFAVVGAEVVEDEVQPGAGWVERADVAAELQELDAGLALLDVPVEPVGADVLGGDQVPDAVRSFVGSSDSLGLGAGCPAAAAGLGLQVQRPELIKADHDLLAGLGKLIQLDDPVTLGLESRVGGALPRSHGLKPDVLLQGGADAALVGDVRDHPLGDKVVRELGQAPGRKRLVEVLGSLSAIRLISWRFGSVKVCGRPPR